MNTTQIIVIGCILGAIGLISLWWGAKTAHDLDKEEDVYVRPKFQPRKVTDLSTSEAPKKKKKRYYNKKKPAVANNAQVEKRSVGRPRKSN